MGDRKYGLITEEDIQNIHVMSEYNFDNATESRSAAAGAAGGAFIKNEYEDRKRRIFEICVFFYWAFCFTLRNEQTTANAL